MQEFQPNIFCKNPRASFKTLDFDRKLYIWCDCQLTYRYLWEPYYIKPVEKTRFSTNTPLLLGAFACCELFEYKNDTYHSSNGLPKEITIVQISAPADTEDEIVLFNGKGHLQLMSKVNTGVTLPELLIIRPGFMY